MLKIYRRLLGLLNKHERRQSFVMLVLIMVMSVFEVAGVAIILPFLAVVADPSQIQSNAILSSVHGLLGAAEAQTFLIQLGLIVFLVILIGTVVKIFTMYAISRFSMMRGYHISSRILEAYLRQPYAWFLNQNSSRMSKTVLDEVNRAVGSVMVPAMRLIAQVVTLVMMTALLVYVDPVAAFGSAAFIAFFYGGIYLVTKGKLYRMGKIMVEMNSARFQVVGEALQGIKEVKLLGLERLYVDQYREPARKQAEALIITRFLGEFPRFALELIAFGGIILLVLLFLVRGDGSVQDVLPVLGMFAIAGFRILGAMQIIFNALATMRAGQATLDLVYKDFCIIHEAPAFASEATGAPLGLRNKLELQKITYSYPQAERTALKNLDFVIPAKSRVGIVGGTGAGKTTMVDLILGLLTPQSGHIVVDGTVLDHTAMRAWRDTLGYVPQQIYLTDDTVAANIAFGVPANCIDHDAVIRAAKLANLHDFVLEQLDQGYDQMVGDRGLRLSGGQRQRIGIARALYHDPDVLVLDEATSALDNLTETAVMDAVSSLSGDKTIILIAHRMTTVENCDIIVLMEQGCIIDQGTYAELVSRNDTFRRMARES